MTFQREFTDTIPQGGTVALAHGIQAAGIITPLIADGDTLVKDGFRVLAKVLNADAGGRMSIAWTSDNILTLTDVGGVGVDFSITIQYRLAMAR